VTVAEFALQTRPRPGRFTLLSPLLVPPQPSRFFNYPRALPQGDRCAWPALASRAIGRKSYLEIHDCAQMLDDILVINGHHIDRVLNSVTVLMKLFDSKMEQPPSNFTFLRFASQLRCGSNFY
jgi:hypothetical protein